MNAVQFDHQAFEEADLTDPNVDQFALGSDSARRLLSDAGLLTGKTPKAHIAARAAKQPKPAARRVLSTMMPVSNKLTAQAIFPQGSVELASRDTSGATASASTAGFVVQGPDATHGKTQQEIEQEQADSDNPFEWVWIATADVNLNTLVADAKILFSVDSVLNPATMFDELNSARFRAAWGFSLVSGLIILLLAVMTTCLLPTIRQVCDNSLKPKDLSWSSLYKEQQASTEQLTYSRTFFSQKANKVKFFSGRMLGIICNELALVYGGYYFYAICSIPLSVVLWGFIGWLPPKDTQNDEFSEYASGFNCFKCLRFPAMGMMYRIFDYSVLEDRRLMRDGAIKYDKGSQGNHIFLFVLSCILRLFMVAFAPFFIGLSIYCMLIYYVIYFVVFGIYNMINKDKKEPQQKKPCNPMFAWQWESLDNGYEDEFGSNGDLKDPTSSLSSANEGPDAAETSKLVV
jgi:hypothetical protein